MLDKVLVVDDEAPVRDLVSRSLSVRGYRCLTAADAATALAQAQQDSPALVVSDISMPGESGVWLLERLKQLDEDMAVVMLTGVTDTQTAIDCLTMGAYNYLVKPVNLKELTLAADAALDKRRLVLENKEYQRSLERKVAERTRQLEDALGRLEESYTATLTALVSALDAREHETGNHSQRVGQYALLIANQLRLDQPLVLGLSQGALLHDIGKIGVPDNILLKPGKLTPEEWEYMRQHPVIGRKILEGVPSLQSAIPLVFSHHERWEGGGYPEGLAAEQIPVEARVFAIADTVDAMTNDRPYRKALTFADAVAEISRCSGSQFWPDAAEAFLTISQDELQAIHRL